MKSILQRCKQANMGQLCVDVGEGIPATYTRRTLQGTGWRSSLLCSLLKNDAAPREEGGGGTESENHFILKM